MPEPQPLQVGKPPLGVPVTYEAREIIHAQLGVVACFYPHGNPRPLVSFTGLVWGPLCSALSRAVKGKKYGEPGYGLQFDKQLPAGSTIDDALAAVEARLRDVVKVVGEARVAEVGQ